MTGNGGSQLVAVPLTILLCTIVYTSVVQGDVLSQNDTWLPDLEQLKDLNFLLLRNIKESETSILQSVLSEFGIPRILKEILGDFKESRNSGKANKILDELFNGVSSADCKGHILEWIHRVVGNEDTNLFSEKDKWVLQMVDAWGKLPEGILTGHMNSIGDFEECVQIKVNDLHIFDPDFPNTATSFEGRYCTTYLIYNNSAMTPAATGLPVVDRSNQVEGGVKVHSQNGIQKAVSVEELLKLILTQNLKSQTGVLIPSIGVCMPNSCSMSDINAFLTNVLLKVYSDNSWGDPKLIPLVATCRENSKPDFTAGDIAMIVMLSGILAVSLIAGVLDYWYSNNAQNDPSTKPNGKSYKYLMAFSFYNNTKKWLSTRKSPDDLGCLHGIRFLSTCWVVLAHTYVIFGMGMQWNMVDVKKIQESWKTLLPIINGTFSVDTFYVLSGTLATYNILKMLDKSKGKFNLLMFYVHRYLRLTPTYAILIGNLATLVVYYGNGPNWLFIEAQSQFCRKYWWTNLLYINNIVHSDEMCHGESWYLANDMQFYILSPFIVYPLWKWSRAGLGLLGIYTILSCISPVLVVRYGNDVPPAALNTSRDLTGGFNELYFKPWSRIQTFLVGVWLGWLLYKTHGKRVHIPRLAVACIWLCATILAIVVIYSIHNWFDPSYEIPKTSGYFYAALSRFSWGLVVAWIIFACIKGYGGVINKFLNWKVFMPLSRLTFCVYLTSMHLQMIFHAKLTTPIKYNTYMMIHLFLGHLALSLIVGYLCTILFESPFIIMQKLAFDDGASSSMPQLRQQKMDDSGTIITKELNSVKRHGMYFENPDTVINTQ